MTPHTLVGGTQTTLTATASARADRRDWPSEAWGPRDQTHTPPLGALDRRAGATGAVGTAEVASLLGEDQCGKGVKLRIWIMHYQRIRITGTGSL